MLVHGARAAPFTVLMGLNLATSALSNSTGDTQIVMNMNMKMPAAKENQSWTVSVSRDWDVLGPFPIHAREQHFMSPSFPLKLTNPIDFNATWSSSYTDGGSVGWTKTQSGDNGLIEVSYPSVRWASLRATEGWAGLQHHSLLRSILTVYPPSVLSTVSMPRLMVNLIQGSFFTILPPSDVKDDTFVPEWHTGNIYALNRVPLSAVSLPYPPSKDHPTTYEIFVSGDYEIRLFGDPRSILGSDVPKLSVSFTVDIEDTAPTVVHIDSHDVISDFIDGWAFGNAVGVGLQSLDGWWTITGASATGDTAESIQATLLERIRIAPTQTRIIPIKITQSVPLRHGHLGINLRLESQDAISEVYVELPVQNHALWSADEVPIGGVKASFFYGTSMPASFIVIPPQEPSSISHPPILALHGAGVDAVKLHRLFWVQGLPRQRYSWVILPAGRTEWGLDWHGPSTRETWNTIEALSIILSARKDWQDWSFAPDTKVLLMGHSNGGQGAWYIAGRYPDRVIGGIVPAAGYIKSQAYVPWVQSRSAHYIDPALRAVLDSSLTPDDNDLFLSNLVDTPILAIHGGNDDNVPVWHTRELVSILKTLNPRANVTYREDSGQPHWYESIFTNDAVQSFVDSTLSGEGASITSRSYTLTVAIPNDSSSLHGWSVYSLKIPGRLGRLSVELQPHGISVRTTNIRSFSIQLSSLPEDVRNAPFFIDGQTLELDEASWDQPAFILALAQDYGIWNPHSFFDVNCVQPTGRISNVLNSVGPITIVIPSESPSALLSAGLRIAHNLNVYHKLDVDIISEDEAVTRMRDGSLTPNNIVVLASGQLGAFAISLLNAARTPFKVTETTLELRGRLLNSPSMGALFLHPHPTSANSLVLFVYGADDDGLERAIRLFPIRTGVTVPDWIVVGSQADERGTGGVHGAGVWGNNWSWNEVMSAF